MQTAECHCVCAYGPQENWVYRTSYRTLGACRHIVYVTDPHLLGLRLAVRCLEHVKRAFVHRRDRLVVLSSRQKHKVPDLLRVAVHLSELHMCKYQVRLLAQAGSTGNEPKHLVSVILSAQGEVGDSMVRRVS